MSFCCLWMRMTSWLDIELVRHAFFCPQKICRRFLLWILLEKTVRLACCFSSCRWLAASALLSVALILHILSNLWCSENKVLVFIISLDFNSPLIVIVILVNLVNNYKISHLRNKFFLCFKYIYIFLVNSFIYFHKLCFRIWEIGLLFVTVILFIWVFHYILFVDLFCFVS